MRLRLPACCREGCWMHLRPWQRHSLVLTVAGAVYVLYGVVSLGLGHLSPDRSATLHLALHPLPSVHISPYVWAGVWVFVGLLALASTRWPPQSKTWGYAAMSGLATCWAVVYALGIPLGAPVSNIGAALVWFLVSFLWWAISGLVNPDDIPEVHSGKGT